MAIEEAQKIRETVSRRAAGRCRRFRSANGDGCRRGRAGRPAAARAEARLMATSGQAQRSPTEIRNSIEANRRELACRSTACAARSRASPTGARHVERHRPNLMAGAAAIGLIVGVKLLRRRRRD